MTSLRTANQLFTQKNYEGALLAYKDALKANPGLYNIIAFNLSRTWQHLYQNSPCASRRRVAVYATPTLTTHDLHRVETLHAIADLVILCSQYAPSGNHQETLHALGTVCLQSPPAAEPHEQHAHALRTLQGMGLLAGCDELVLANHQGIWPSLHGLFHGMHAVPCNAWHAAPNLRVIKKEVLDNPTFDHHWLSADATVADTFQQKLHAAGFHEAVAGDHLDPIALADPTNQARPAKQRSPARFSVIMPTYNRKACIARAIDSALAQPYPYFELIVVDDGSTDGTDTLIRTHYADALHNGQLVYLQQPKRGGVSHARNAGLASARYDWIAYLDSDNALRPWFFNLFASAIAHHPTQKTFYAHFQPASGRPVVGKPFNYRELQQANFIDLGVFVHHASLTKGGHGFDTQLKRLVDWDLILRLTQHQPPTYLPYVVMDYNDQENATDRISTQESFEKAKQRLRQKGLINP